MEIKNLENKIWYRTLKVVYVLAYGLAIVGVVIGAYYAKPQFYPGYQGYSTYFPAHTIGSWDDVILTLVMGLPAVWLFFQIVKRLFFYIGFGKKFLETSHISWRRGAYFFGTFGSLILFTYLAITTTGPLQTALSIIAIILLVMFWSLIKNMQNGN
jgi:hypothetical protein